MKRGLHTGLLLAALAAAGCAVPVAPASSSYHGGDPVYVRRALERAGQGTTGPMNAGGRPLAFVVVSRPGNAALELWAFDIEAGSLRWNQALDVPSRGLEGRVVVARSVVVHPARGGALVARDIATGAIKWQKVLGNGLARVGYAAGGDLVAEVTEKAPGTGGDGRTATLTVYDAASGSTRFSRAVDGPVGAPVIYRGLVAVPRQSQWVTLIDDSGDTLAEILSRKQAATFVRPLPEGLFFGSNGVFMATPATATADKAGPAYLEAKVPPFVRPLYNPDLYRKGDSAYSAVDRNRLLWRVTPNGEAAAFRDGTVVVHNFRFFFALDAKSGALRWAFNQPRTDAISSEHTGPSILFVTTEGHVKALDARTGALTYDAPLPGAGEGALSVVGATFDADGFALRGGAGGVDLAKSLSSMILDPDKRFSDVRMFALEQLTQLSGPEVTRELLKALDNGDVIPSPVLKRAMDVLVERQDQALLPVYMEALRVHPDYAEGQQPRRLDFYARAVAALKAKNAVPLLVEYLRLPDTEPDAVTEISEAVLALEARQSVEPFGDFLLQYRADPAFVSNPAPLISASNVLLKLGGAKERSLLNFVAEEPQTLEALAEHLRRALVPAEEVIKKSE
ncbi:MAG TPA: PQQ-binding-like beta-propeller repeat protein [Polyangia bacterium]